MVEFPGIPKKEQKLSNMNDVSMFRIPGIDEWLINQMLFWRFKRQLSTFRLDLFGLWENPDFGRKMAC